MKINRNLSINDSGFVFNPITGESFNVNPIGAYILMLLKQDTPEEEIKKLLTEKYETDMTTIEKDYYDFLLMLKTLNLVEEEK